MKRSHVFALATVTAIIGPAAFAHEDPNDDGNRYSTTRCDTYYRDGHYGSNTTPKGARHSEDHNSEFDKGDVTGTGLVYVHDHTGHYAVRGDGYYVEVIGGGGFNRDGNQGGFAQGEVDPVEGGPDVDFHGGAYAGTNGDMHSENACVSAAENKVGESGVQDTGVNGTYCVIDPVESTCTFTAYEDGLRVYSEASTGYTVLIKRGTTVITNTTVDGPVVNDSRSFAMRAGDKVTCTLVAGAAPAAAGRVSCSG